MKVKITATVVIAVLQQFTAIEATTAGRDRFPSIIASVKRRYIENNEKAQLHRLLNEFKESDSCKSSFTECLSNLECRDCFASMEAKNIEWSDGTECTDVINVVNLNEKVCDANLEKEGDARNAFCNIINNCAVTKKDDNNGDIDDFDDSSSCIEAKCVIQLYTCEKDTSCRECMKDDSPTYCDGNSNFKALNTCSLCNCLDKEQKGGDINCGDIPTDDSDGDKAKPSNNIIPSAPKVSPNVSPIVSPIVSPNVEPKSRPVLPPNSNFMGNQTPRPSKPYIPQYNDDDDDDDDDFEDITEKQKKGGLSGFWKFAFFCIVVGLGYWYYQRRNRFDYMFQARSYNPLNEQLTMENSTSFEPPQLPPPPSAYESNNSNNYA